MKKMEMIVDSSGKILGCVFKDREGGTPGAKLGMVPMQDQVLLEVEVPNEIEKLEPKEFFEKLSGINAVKEAIRTSKTAKD